MSELPKLPLASHVKRVNTPKQWVLSPAQSAGLALSPHPRAAKLVPRASTKNFLIKLRAKPVLLEPIPTLRGVCFVKCAVLECMGLHKVLNLKPRVK
eukprot:UC4_evm1s1045